MTEGISFIFFSEISISLFGNLSITFLRPLGTLGVSTIIFSIIWSKNRDKYGCLFDIIKSYIFVNISSYLFIYGCTDTIHKHFGINHCFNFFLLWSIDISFGLLCFIVLRRTTINLLSSNLYLSFNLEYESILSYITRHAKYFRVYIALYNWLSNTTQ